MNIFKKRIFLQLIISLSGGMFSAYIIGTYLPLWYLFVVLLFLFSIYIFIHKNYLYTLRYSWLYGLSIHLFMFIAGFNLLINEQDLNKKNHFINYSKADFLIVKISEPPVFKNKFVRCIVKTTHSGTLNSTVRTSGNAVAYFSITNESLKFKYGDMVVLKNKPSLLNAPVIPYQYDYKGYLEKRNIHFTLFLKPSEFFPVNKNIGFVLLRKAFDLRDWCSNCIKKYVNSKKEASVVSALTVGYRDEISQEVVQSYSSAGVIHILAVSGMHVGLLYFMLEYFLKFLNRNRNSKILKLLIILCILWMFAMVTGLGGSIVRASAMISVLIIGKFIKRRIDIVDSLCSSAFIILVISPFTLIDAGFQLSFSALIGIALWENKFSQLIEWRNPIFHFVWRMCSVSMAAQLGVLPLTLFYFNQFPAMFLLANVVGVPLSTLILYGGLILFIFSPITHLAIFIGAVLKTGTQVLDSYIYWIQSFSYSTINIPAFGIQSLICMVIALYFFSNFIETKKINQLKFSLLAVLLIITINSVANFKYLLNNEIMFLHFGKGDAYIFREKNNALLIVDDSLSKDEYFSQYTSSFLKHTCVSNLQIVLMSKLNDSTSISWKNFKSFGQFISFENMTGCFLNTSILNLNKNLKLDFVAGKITLDKIASIKNLFSPEIIIANKVVQKINISKIKNQCSALSLPFHYLPMDGPWIKTF